MCWDNLQVVTVVVLILNSALPSRNKPDHLLLYFIILLYICFPVWRPLPAGAPADATALVWADDSPCRGLSGRLAFWAVWSQTELDLLCVEY